MVKVSEDAHGEEKADVRLGAAIRARRKELGRTLVQIATETGLSHPFLSQIERGRARPSMRSLFLIAESLGTTQQALLAQAYPIPVDGRVVRANRKIDGAGPGMHEARLVDHDPGSADVTEMVISTSDWGSFFSHARRELVYVVSGRIEVELSVDGSGDHPSSSEFHELGPRDSIAYPAGTQHRHRRIGPEPAIVLLVHSGSES
ncbi:XRE family transcriptional regulator [Rhodococcus sp. WS4]|nr:XRE family transcriptional regulator [Rhodococcus sp. WS4]